MCHAPCCGTPQDILNLIEAGYGPRLMLDNYPDVSRVDLIIKPALKGYEGKRSPWETESIRGCTFWKDGLCELHNNGLKPIQGRLAHHSNSEEQIEAITSMINDSWSDEELVNQTVEMWKQSLK